VRGSGIRCGVKVRRHRTLRTRVAARPMATDRICRALDGSGQPRIVGSGRGRDSPGTVVMARWMAQAGERGVVDRASVGHLRSSPIAVRSIVRRMSAWRASGEFSLEVSAAGRRAPTWAGMEMNAAITSTVTGMTAGSCQSGGFAVSSPLTAETSARPPGGPRRLRPRRWGAMIARVWRRTAAAADGDACARYPEDGVADYCATLGNWGCPSLAARGLRPSTDARVSRLTEPDDVAPGVDKHTLGSGDGLQVKVQLGPRQRRAFL
jgi:hypothetical protein